MNPSLPINGQTQVFGIFGYPVKHTFSPHMHNAAFRQLNLNARYLPFEVNPNQIGEAVQAIRALNLKGLNVTVPHKTAVIPYLDELTPIAQCVGAVNTIRNDQGRLIGTNTDGHGFVRSLQEFGFTPQNKNILILGAGGSARSIIAALGQEHASRISLINRTQEKAEKLLEELRPMLPEVELNLGDLEQERDQNIDLLVNTTSVGMKPGESPVDLGCFLRVRRVADIIYNPRQTRLLEQATELGIACVNGIGMLLHQGCLAFEFWTGQSAPVEVMQQELLNQL